MKKLPSSECASSSSLPLTHFSSSLNSFFTTLAGAAYQNQRPATLPPRAALRLDPITRSKGASNPPHRAPSLLTPLLLCQVVHVTQQLEHQIAGTSPCSRSFRRKAASILQQIQRLQAMDMSGQLKDATANVDAAKTLHALFCSIAQLQRLTAATR
jgi:hypothetical protein